MAPTLPHRGEVARGEHPQRTPAYGAALIVAAMVGSTVVTLEPVPMAGRIPVYVAAFLAAGAGFVMTLRDRTW